ncbi:MAG: hypothetical protein ACOC22_04850, partial [bacterium]
LLKIINEEIIRFSEEYLGIDSITKDDYKKSMESQEYWALFAHLYEKYFYHVNTEEDVNDMRDKLLSQTNNPRIIKAIHYFADLRKNEIN